MIYSGYLDIDEYECLLCGDSYIIESISECFKKNDKVLVTYYISNKEITLEKAKEALILKTCGGNIDKLDFILDAYSSWTIFDYNEELIIGGHDLFNELGNYVNKYLILIIDKIA